MSGRWGIEPGYRDALGAWHDAAPETRAKILAAMGVADDEAEPTGSPVRVVRSGAREPLGAPAEIALEDGGRVHAATELPADLPLGYHELRRAGEPPLRLIVAPPRCHSPAGLRTSGWALQLYALRSERSWGIGDLADLRRFAAWTASLGLGLVLVNPLQASSPLVPQQPSPYFPSSRRFRNPLYLAVEDVPGAGTAIPELERLAREGRALNRDRRIDRDAVFRTKMAALEILWRRFERDDRFERWRERQGSALAEFATFAALAERHGKGWRSWPAEHRRPSSPAVARFAAANAARIGFHEWLQWLLDEQLALAAAPLALMQDLPVGVDPEGADAWAWQDVLASGVTVGAPPDEYNTRGQDWGFPPFVPHRLRARGYDPFIETVRATLRHAGGLRVDHVMGLFRLFWIPQGAGPEAGTYVRYPADDLLAILALESVRAAAVVVGEDLGTVESGVRERLAEEAILSYRLVWFETDSPEQFPEAALAAVTTHDLPTIAGLWSGSDLRAQRALGLAPNEAGTEAIRHRLAATTGVAPGADVEAVIVRTHERLRRAPSRLVTATLEDALAVEERPNMPGTTGTWPNWSIALPATLEEIERHPLVARVAAALRR